MNSTHCEAQVKGDSDKRGAMDLAVIGACSLAYLLDGIVFTILGPMAPDLARALSLSNVQLGQTFSANLIGQCIGLVFFPLIGHRASHRLIIVSTLCGFGIFQAASGLAMDAGQLFWLRLVTGFFLGGSLPSCLAMTTAAAPPHRRGLAITILFTGYAIGSTVAGFVPVLFANLGGWRVAMAAVGVVCLVFALVAWPWLRDPQPEQTVDTHQEGAMRAVAVL